ncbi:PAS domain-containing protein [Hyphomonas sp. KY3]|uniref:PAS domain-containing protein n=1 Tax=hydrothermal vent metagenome TaxID=652676 RepID=A0A160TYC1_9ZZZZ|nr:PAS domain-containing protein [Hyphomonas sp. KY3]QSR22957.1 hypothetical protein CFA77_11715 [Hyphomonas sp. KY3]
MHDRSIHPNTRIMLEAWKRMSVNPASEEDRTPRANDHPDLITNIFMIQSTQDGAWIFRTAGDGVSQLLGRTLPNHDFLALWTGPDRSMVSGLLDAVRLDSAPGVIRGSGETLTGQRVEVEITLMPLAQSSVDGNVTRFLGLYQTLGGLPMLKGRPIWRHRLAMLVPPDTRRSEPALKLVASNAH